MSPILRSATATDVGLVRTNNEDSAYAGTRLVAVADGIGGAPSGELASDLVIRSLARLEDWSGGQPLAALRAAIDAANDQIRAAIADDRAQDGMGTTVTVLLLAGEQLALFHVGDSRCYRLRDGRLSQLTTDDTFVQSLVEQGVLTPAEARRHPQRSVVTEAVQGGEFIPDCALLTPQPGDRYLLCSDGLSDYVADDLIAQTLQAMPDLDQCAEQLVKLTLQAGAPDNVTVIVADIG